jgi:hypothetical protein
MLMCVTARVAAKVRAPSSAPVLTQQYQQLLDEAEAVAKAADADPNFWNAVATADVQLLLFLAAGDLDENKRKQVEEAYLRRWNRGGSWLKFQSVLRADKILLGCVERREDRREAARVEQPAHNLVQHAR